MDLPELKRKRGFAKAALTRIEKVTADLAFKDLAAEELYVHLELLEKAYIEFKDYDEQIVDIDDTLTEIEEFVPRYIKIKGIIRKAVSGQNPMLQAVQMQMNETMTSFSNYQKEILETMKDTSFNAALKEENIKLPRLQIPSFDGNNYDEFHTFKHLYDTAVHNNPSISDIHKFQYLKGLLTGKASKIIIHIPLTTENYDEAYQKLCKRFDKPDQVYKSLIDKFMKIPSAASGSATGIRNLCDTSEEVIRGLNVLGKKAQTRDPWLIYILLSKLDEKIQRKWTEKTTDDPYLTFESFIQFLEKRCTTIESVERETCQRRKPARSSSFHINTSAKTTTANTKDQKQSSTFPKRFNSEVSCLKCNSLHLLHECEKFRELPVYQRKEFVATARVCYNCMYKGHSSKYCPSRHRCFICQRKHHTLLHDAQELDRQKCESVRLAEPKVEKNTSSEPKESVSTAHQINALVCNSIHVKTSLLPTALVRVIDKYGNQHHCRILLDSGSTGCLMTEACAQRLQVQRKNLRIPVEGVTSETVSRGCTDIMLIPHFDTDFTMEVQVVILKRLTSRLPRLDKNILSKWPEIKKLPLSDPLDSVHHDIDIILGAAQCFRLLRPGCVVGPNDLTAQNTALGWIVSGETSTNKQNSISLHVEFNVDESLRKFWELEEIPVASKLTPHQQFCEDLFAASHARAPDGRFIVKLPFSTNSPPLGRSLEQAVSRFHSIERRLHRDETLNKEYKRVMHEYLNLNHMEEIDAKNLDLKTEHFYLPHHPVIKPESKTSKVRIVFDGSAKTTTSISLNDKLLVGPTIQSDLIDIIMRFRSHQIAFSADITQMYRQIRIVNEDCKYQRIVWRDDPRQPLKHFHLLTATFGTASAPFHATRAVHQLGMDNIASFSKASKALMKDLYVDDLLTGSNTIQEAQVLANDIINILKTGGFSLHKWASNSPQFLESISSKQDNETLVELYEESDHKVLGLHWDTHNDCFRFKVNMPEPPKSLTKRRLLSDASRLFDPLGWLSPVTITAKSLFQQLWLLHIGWDDKLPSDVSGKWRKIHDTLMDIEDIRIPRFINAGSTMEIHGFSDASKIAYAAAVYSRDIDSNGNVHVNLIAAKTRVAPISHPRLTVPRIELSGAHLLAKLIKVVTQSLRCEKCNVFAWTDSEVVLHWLTKLPCHLPIFVGNRTAQILEEIPNAIWGHVRSADNPADCASKGILPTELVNHKLWWKGPPWLLKDRETWPQNKTKSFADVVEPSTIIKCHAMQAHPCLFDELTKRHSSYNQIKRILGYCYKFVINCRKGRDKSTENRHVQSKLTSIRLTSEGLRKAEEYLCKWAQQDEFHEELQTLSAKKQVVKGRLSSLAPFLDDNGVLRVGGRLHEAACSYSQKHPIILPPSHVLSVMILSCLHKQYLHPGPSLLSHLSKLSYWIVRSRPLVRKITNNCSICRRLRCQPSAPMMGNLPEERVSSSRAFNYVGVDFAGPIQIATKKGRGSRYVKGYISIFVCMTIKAVHLEPVSDLSSEAFIGAFKRFVSRRGIPSVMYSDNGTNFVGAKRKLSEMQQQLFSTTTNNDVIAYITQHKIEWKFNPPSTPWFGGLWESAVKSMKHHLIRATGNSKLTHEEMSTIITQIEAILNSRPLTPTIDDESALFVLTPAHFLLAHPLLAIPEQSYVNYPENRLSKWQNINKRLNSFWSRFRKEYLHTLQQRRKWKTKNHENIQINDVVFVRDEETPPLSWPLGRILDVHPGKDGIVRVVTLKTARSTLKRPVAKLTKIFDQDDDIANHLNKLK